jgi:hypothetical protein
LLTAAIATAASLASQAVLALPCEGANILNEDHFDDIEPSWQRDDVPTIAEDNHLKLKAPREGKTVIEPGFLTAEGQICVTLRSPHEMTDPSATEAGLVFRAERIPGGAGEHNYMFFALSPAGRANLWNCEYQLQRSPAGGARLIPHFKLLASWKPDISGVRKGKGATNILQVTLRSIGVVGAELSLSVNDTTLPLRPLSLRPLAGGGEIGLRAVSEPGRTNTWKFSDLVVTELPPQERD